MTHLAISESDPERPVVWKEALSEKSYVEGAMKAESAICKVTRDMVIYKPCIGDTQWRKENLGKPWGC